MLAAVAGARYLAAHVTTDDAFVEVPTVRVSAQVSGRVEEVLVEGPSKRDPAVLSGRTRQNKLVHFTPPTPLRTGSYASVEITRGAPHFLEGRFVELLAEPTHKLRIPVASL